MSLFFSMLPIYLFGNLHCLGMCGPLVMMIGHHRFRHFYFLGRLFSYSLAGMTAGALGAVANVSFKQYHFAEALSLFFGGFLIILAVCLFTGWRYPGQMWLARRLAGANQALSLLMLKDQAWPAFLFGFFTLALPCGQTLIVFSACALFGDPIAGLLNGAAFALLTSPSLFMAMQAHGLLRKAKKYYQTVIAFSALAVGVLAILRGLAEMGIIAHWVINPEQSGNYHLVIF